MRRQQFLWMFAESRGYGYLLDLDGDFEYFERRAHLDRDLVDLGLKLHFYWYFDNLMNKNLEFDWNLDYIGYLTLHFNDLLDDDFFRNFYLLYHFLDYLYLSNHLHLLNYFSNNLNLLDDLPDNFNFFDNFHLSDDLFFNYLFNFNILRNWHFYENLNRHFHYLLNNSFFNDDNFNRHFHYLLYNSFFNDDHFNRHLHYFLYNFLFDLHCLLFHNYLNRHFHNLLHDSFLNDHLLLLDNHLNRNLHDLLHYLFYNFLHLHHFFDDYLNRHLSDSFLEECLLHHHLHWYLYNSISGDLDFCFKVYLNGNLKDFNVVRRSSDWYCWCAFQSCLLTFFFEVNYFFNYLLNFHYFLNLHDLFHFNDLLNLHDLLDFHYFFNLDDLFHKNDLFHFNHAFHRYLVDLYFRCIFFALLLFRLESADDNTLFFLLPLRVKSNLHWNLNYVRHNLFYFDFYRLSDGHLFSFGDFDSVFHLDNSLKF
jgi:hypothetical protein